VSRHKCHSLLACPRRIVLVDERLAWRAPTQADDPLCSTSLAITAGSMFS
jgi:hypothetical protein